jgi:hypothetical protein
MLINVIINTFKNISAPRTPLKNNIPSLMESFFDTKFVDDDVSQKIRKGHSKQKMITVSTQLWKNNHLCLTQKNLSIVDKSTCIIVSKGVRNSLESLIQYFGLQTKTIYYIPSSVYPVYESIIDKFKVNKKITNTHDVKYPFTDLFHKSVVSSDITEIAILTIPLPHSKNIDTKPLLTWLIQKSLRYIIIDSVHSNCWN